MSQASRGTLHEASHPGYPLLVPSAVASAWTLTGGTASSTPAALSVLFTLATAGLLCSAVTWLRGEASGLLAALLLFASEGFVSQAASQYADIPLGLYLLATVALLALAMEGDWPRDTLILAGLCCGLAAWTKNEGIPFFVWTFAMVAYRGGKKALFPMTLGALPVVALLLAFKLFLVAEAEALFPKTVGEALIKAGDASRWIQIAESFAKSIFEMGSSWWTHPLVLGGVLAVAFGLAPRDRIRHLLWLAIPVFGLLAADFLIYVITTVDLAWHLATSNLRLWVQVWPALLFLMFLILAPPTLAAEGSTNQAKEVRTRAERKRRKASSRGREVRG